MTENKLSDQELKEIREEAEKEYPDVLIEERGIMELWEMYEYNDMQGYKRESYIAAITRERERVKGLLEDRDNFAIAYSIWAMYDPQAIAYREAGITAYGLLEKYKDRPFVNTFNPEQQ